MTTFLYKLVDSNTEHVFCIFSNPMINYNDKLILKQILGADFTPMLETKYFTIGPKFTRTTSWSTNFVSILHKIGISNVYRVEKFIRTTQKCNYDELTQQIVKSGYFGTSSVPESVIKLPTEEDITNYNKKCNLGLSNQEIHYYCELLFKERPATNLEIYDLAQSNSEHSRHHFFRGNLVIDGEPVELPLMSYIKMTLTEDTATNNSLIAFCDDASAIKGPVAVCAFYPDEKHVYSLNADTLCPMLTAETHNFPTGISPFHGATTGTGGRIRDNQSIGRGGQPIAGSTGYCVGDLSQNKISCNQKPLDILIEASNGASDYGNKFGEPIIYGFCRSYFNEAQQRGWIKPIMFTSGVGQVRECNLVSEKLREGDLIVKIGGPCYRIGLGGGSCSSGNNQGDLELAVQRGDAEMEQKLNRVIRTCCESDRNIIKTIHDQGAGGNGNVLKEIVEGYGGEVYLNKIESKDSRVGSLEKWVAEYQESNAIVIAAKDKSKLKEICHRESLPVNFIGVIKNTGKLQVYLNKKSNESPVVDFELEKVLQCPKKTFHLTKTSGVELFPIDNIFANFSFEKILQETCSLLSVGSKRFLVNKVDRSVTGLIVQQQCVGPLHTPISDYAVVAQSYFGNTGIVTAIGEQPIKAFLNSGAMARLTVGEMITNMIFCPVTKFEDIKCSGNWMWPAKLPGEGAEMVKAVQALSSHLLQLGIGIDGGKDSLSMVAYSDTNLIPCPRSLVLTGYCICKDIRKCVTSDLKSTESKLILIPFNNSYRLGGSALLQVYQQLGNKSDCPDSNNPDKLVKIFNCIQHLLSEHWILAGHDRSDGGLVVTLLEMAIAGNIGLSIQMESKVGLLQQFFNEELGIVLEIHCNRYQQVCNYIRKQSIKIIELGKTCSENTFTIIYNNKTVLNLPLTRLRDFWEHTSNQLELLQSNPDTASQQIEHQNVPSSIHCPESVIRSVISWIPIDIRPKIAIVREEGSNGDREMAAAFFTAGFEVHDVMTNDLLNGKCNLLNYRGAAFVGGFSYSDVPRAAVGWHTVLTRNANTKKMLRNFFSNKDCFTLGICNGFQLQILLGLFGKNVNFTQNVSGRFESRFPSVRITKSESIALRGLEDCVLGVWTAHSEGNIRVNGKLTHADTCLYYADEFLLPTERYPYCPNGSHRGIAGLTTKDGRHLGFFGHIERSFLDWQLPYNPHYWPVSPWLCCFQNLYDWCVKTKGY